MRFLDKQIMIKVTEKQIDRIKSLMKGSEHKYSSLSHFVRCAIEAKLREEEEK